MQQNSQPIIAADIGGTHVTVAAVDMRNWQTIARPPYGSDGDYFSKPSADDVIEAVYAIMHDSDPQQYPALFG